MRLWCLLIRVCSRKWLTPRRFSDPDYAASIAGELYGGTVRAHGEDVAGLFLQQLHAGSKMGYLHQLLAGSVWSSLFALRAVRQQTLIVAGTDDPIIPMVNAHIMNALLPHSRLHQHSGGHIDLVHNTTRYRQGSRLARESRSSTSHSSARKDSAASSACRMACPGRGRTSS